MASLPKGMAKSSLQMKKASAGKKKGTVTKAAIGAPIPDSTPDTPPDTSTPPPATTPNTSNGGRTEYKPKSYGTFEPVGIPNDDEWHHDDAHVVSEHMLNYNNGNGPMDTVRYWYSNNGEHLRNAQPYDPQHGDYSGFGAPGNPHPDGPPGYVGDVGTSAPKAKSPGKPSGDQHASYSAGSVEAVRYSPGSFATGITNGMTNRDKYVR